MSGTDELVKARTAYQAVADENKELQAACDELKIQRKAAIRAMAAAFYEDPVAIVQAMNHVREQHGLPMLYHYPLGYPEKLDKATTTLGHCPSSERVGLGEV